MCGIISVSYFGVPVCCMPILECCAGLEVCVRVCREVYERSNVICRHKEKKENNKNVLTRKWKVMYKIFMRNSEMKKWVQK